MAQPLESTTRMDKGMYTYTVNIILLRKKHISMSVLMRHDLETC